MTAECDNGITAEWDYNAWNLKVDNITKGTKCTLAFNSKLTEEDYKEYIEAGVSYRRNTYRGKDLTDFFTNHSTEFYQQISSGHFDDIFVGDYIVDNKSGKKDINNNTVIYIVADIDNYMNTGNGTQILKNHHLTMIPTAPLIKAKMNDTNDNTKGYTGSKMYTTTLPDVLKQCITPVFGEHILKHSNTLSNGYSLSIVVNDRQVDLMSEVSVYGQPFFSMPTDIGMDHQQYMLFKLKPKFINSDGNNNFSYWTRSVDQNSLYFSYVPFQSNPALLAASSEIGVRPSFLIG